MGSILICRKHLLELTEEKPSKIDYLKSKPNRTKEEDIELESLLKAWSELVISKREGCCW